LVICNPHDFVIKGVIDSLRMPAIFLEKPQRTMALISGHFKLWILGHGLMSLLMGIC
jgi:hypothetical protein